MIKIYRTKDYDEMSRRTAAIIFSQITCKPCSVLGLATGSTPVGTYEQLVKWYREGLLDFSGISTVNLDEYRGLDGSSSQSYRFFMNRHLFRHVNIDLSHTHLPDGTAADAEQECARYDRLIEALGGIDLQLLGLGNNGHIGFNEPSAAFAKGTHCVHLAASTIRANARFFSSAGQVPTQAYTMGIGSIMQAKKILLAVSGAGKAEIVQRVLCGPVTPEVPASILQFHRDVTLVGDEGALSLLPESNIPMQP